MTKTLSNKILFLSDLHFGKWIQAGPGREAYDLDTADQRLRSIAGKLSATEPPDVLHIMLGGDLVDGSGIYPHQDTTLDSHPLEQVAVCVGALWHVISELSGWAPQIRVRSVRGNHGRLHPTADPRSNWDNQVAYSIAERAMSVDNVDVDPNYGISCVHPVGRWRIAMLHRAEKHGATPAMQARILRRLRHYRADLLLGAHWHTPGWYELDGDPILCVNGCLPGPDEYAEQLGAFGPPKQALITANGQLSCDWLEF